MARGTDPRERIPGTRTRFRYPVTDNRYALIGVATAVVVLLIIGFFVVGNWIGTPGNPRHIGGNEPGAVQPGASPNAPANR